MKEPWGDFYYLEGSIDSVGLKNSEENILRIKERHLTGSGGVFVSIVNWAQMENIKDALYTFEFDWEDF